MDVDIEENGSQYRTLRHFVGGMSRIRDDLMDVDEGLSVVDL